MKLPMLKEISLSLNPPYRYSPPLYVIFSDSDMICRPVFYSTSDAFPFKDPVADWNVVADLVGSASHVPRLTTVTIPSQHWPQLEKPDEFNSILENWLKTLPPREPGAADNDRVRSSRTEGEL